MRLTCLPTENGTSNLLETVTRPRRWVRISMELEEPKLNFLTNFTVGVIQNCSQTHKAIRDTKFTLRMFSKELSFSIYECGADNRSRSWPARRTNHINRFSYIFSTSLLLGVRIRRFNLSVCENMKPAYQFYT
jgi:hypothetical protein